MQYTLIWHGHSNFQLVTHNISLCIDPFFDGNPNCLYGVEVIIQPDVVLVTHDHSDHVGQALEICRRYGARLGAITGTVDKLMVQSLPEELAINCLGFNIGGTVVVNGVSITMTQATHSSESGMAVGYILTLEDGYTIYHAGDTGIFAGMELWGRLYSIDLALLPIGGVFTMDARQAAMACQLLKCNSVVPMHWGTFQMLEKNTQSFRCYLREISPFTNLIELAPGKPIILEKHGTRSISAGVVMDGEIE
ncbi:conserved hypothetical protein [Desulfovibrionales bacterium]